MLLHLPVLAAGQDAKHGDYTLKICQFSTSSKVQTRSGRVNLGAKFLSRRLATIWAVL